MKSAEEIARKYGGTVKAADVAAKYGGTAVVTPGATPAAPAAAPSRWPAGSPGYAYDQAEAARQSNTPQRTPQQMRQTYGRPALPSQGPDFLNEYEEPQYALENFFGGAQDLLKSMIPTTMGRTKEESDDEYFRRVQDYQNRDPRFLAGRTSPTSLGRSSGRTGYDFQDHLEPLPVEDEHMGVLSLPISIARDVVKPLVVNPNDDPTQLYDAARGAYNQVAGAAHAILDPIPDTLGGWWSGDVSKASRGAANVAGVTVPGIAGAIQAGNALLRPRQPVAMTLEQARATNFIAARGVRNPAQWDHMTAPVEVQQLWHQAAVESGFDTSEAAAPGRISGMLDRSRAARTFDLTDPVRADALKFLDMTDSAVDIAHRPLGETIKHYEKTPTPGTVQAETVYKLRSLAESNLDDGVKSALNKLANKVEKEGSTIGGLDGIKSYANKEVSNLRTGSPGADINAAAANAYAYKLAANTIRDTLYPALRDLGGPDLIEFGRREALAIQARDGAYAQFADADPVHASQGLTSYLDLIETDGLPITGGQAAGRVVRGVARQMARAGKHDLAKFNETFKTALGTIGEGFKPETVSMIPRPPEYLEQGGGDAAVHVEPANMGTRRQWVWRNPPNRPTVAGGAEFENRTFEPPPVTIRGRSQTLFPDDDQVPVGAQPVGGVLPGSSLLESPNARPSGAIGEAIESYRQRVDRQTRNGPLESTQPRTRVTDEQLMRMQEKYRVEQGGFGVKQGPMQRPQPTFEQWHEVNPDALFPRVEYEKYIRDNYTLKPGDAPRVERPQQGQLDLQKGIPTDLFGQLQTHPGGPGFDYNAPTSETFTIGHLRDMAGQIENQLRAARTGQSGQTAQWPRPAVEFPGTPLNARPGMRGPFEPPPAGTGSREAVIAEMERDLNMLRDEIMRRETVLRMRTDKTQK